MSTISEDELEAQNLNSNVKKPDRKPTGDDPISDQLLRTYYWINSDSFQMVKIGAFLAPFIAIGFFYLFVSSSTSNLIAFSALSFSIFFMAFSIWLLCWILDKDVGTRAMQDVSDPIKEGSEGFFITQYGTIFQLAAVCSVLLFLVYL
jgi:Inorganic H+ pyrophosphatase